MQQCSLASELIKGTVIVTIIMHDEDDTLVCTCTCTCFVEIHVYVTDIAVLAPNP